MEGGEPLAVIDQLRHLGGDQLLIMHGIPIQADGLQDLMGLVQDAAARGLVYAPALDAHQPVFHDVRDAAAIGPAQGVELFDEADPIHLDPVQGNRHALFKADLHIGGHVRGILGQHAHLQEAVGPIGLVGRVLQLQPLVGQMPQVLILGIVGLPADLQGDVMGFRIGDLILPALHLPGPPGGDDLHIGGQGLDGELEPHLVVALAGAAMGNGVCALGEGDLRNPLGDHRPGNGGTQ